MLKDREPEKPFQARGTAIHKALEIFLKTGEVLPDVDGVSTLEFVQVAIPFLPPPLINKEYWGQFPTDDKGVPKAMLLLEQPGELNTYEGGPAVTQYIDSVLALPSTCKIQDYKTTSDFRYAKTPEELSTNTQLCWNAKFIFAISDYDRIEIEHLYLLTKGRPKAKPVSTFVTRAQVEEVWARDMALVRQMVSWADLGPTTADPLPPNTNACDDYGGCYYRTKCGFDVATVGWKKRTEPMSELQKNGLLAQLLKSVENVAPQSTVVQQTRQALKTGKQDDLLAALGKGPAAQPETIFDANKPTSSAADNLRAAMSTKQAEAPVGITPPDAPPATSTPEEVEAANAPKEEAKPAEDAVPLAVEGEAPAKPKRGRGRPAGSKILSDAELAKQVQTAETAPPGGWPSQEEVNGMDLQASSPVSALDTTLTNEGAVATPPPAADVVDSVENLRKILMTPDAAFECGLKVLFIDTLPAKGWQKDQPVDLATMMHAFEKLAAQAAKKPDYRQIPYEGKAYLKNAITVLMKGLPRSVFMDSRIPGADVFLTVVTPYCEMIFRGIR